MTLTTTQQQLFPPSVPTPVLAGLAAVGLAVWVVAHVIEGLLRRGRWPWQAIAFRFLEPITAPNPGRPAARQTSCMIAAKRTSRSPPGPT